MDPWVEAGERVLARRYPFFDQNIVAILTDDGPVVVDTRTTYGQADEILLELRAVDRRPVVAVINTHGHYDHVFGNHRFRPAPIWGHVRCAAMIRETGDRQRAATSEEIPGIADELRDVELDPPDRTFDAAADLVLGGRQIELRWLGRGHTDNDIVVRIPDANVLLAGDLLENDATPYFGDGFPLDWPATADALLGLLDDASAVVPGHGSIGDRAFAERQRDEFRAVAALARRIDAGSLDLEAAIVAAPYPPASAREPLERALMQLRGELD